MCLHSSKIKLLESMGFVSIYTDVCLTHLCAPGVLFDFSTTPNELVVQTAIDITMKRAYELGSNNTQVTLFRNHK
jgi:hypothetical protein